MTALRGFIKELQHFGGATCYETEGQDESLRDPDNCQKCRLEDIAGEAEQHIALAQQAAYERAAQAMCDRCRLDGPPEDLINDCNPPRDGGPRFVHVEDQSVHRCEAAEIRALGSASALELALAQARRKGFAEAHDNMECDQCAAKRYCWFKEQLNHMDARITALRSKIK